MIEEEPHLFIVLGEVSPPSYAVLFSTSPLQQHKKTAERSWHETEKRESKLGQLLMYLLGGHLQRLRAIRHIPRSRPTPVLGLYLENMKVLQAQPLAVVYIYICLLTCLLKIVHHLVVCYTL